MTKSVKQAADDAEARAAQTAKRNATDEDFNWPEEGKNGPLKNSLANVQKAIEELKLECSYDEFLDVYTVKGKALDGFDGELNDIVARKFREVCFEKFKYQPGKEATFDGLQRECEQNRFNSLQDMLSATVWDGKQRLYTWLTTYMGVEDSPLHRAWGELFLMAAARRAFDPGCKWDHVLVFEGPEGGGKSSAIKILACGTADKHGTYFSDAPILHVQSREQQELTRGVWLYEIAELAAMRKADQYLVKRFVTAEGEKARAAYAHFLTKQPRVSVFFGSFNTDANTGALVEYLNPGDRRRWWPVRVGEIDLLGLARDRLQLFAEALARAKSVSGEPWDDVVADDWRELRLDSSLWSDATEVQKERELTNPLSLRLEGLFERLTKGAKAYHVGDYTWSLDKDWTLDAEGVWVRASMIVELVGRFDVSGRNTPVAMGTLGWLPERRGKARTRGYVHPV